MNLLQRLIEACACEVSITINAHRNSYETAEQFLESPSAEWVDIDDAVRAEMIRRDSVIDIQAYPKTPVGFYRVLHWDLDTALQHIVDAIDA